MNSKTTMVKVITLSLIASTMVHATNGDNLIAVGTKARGMGGVSIAVSHGAESGLSNPALITSVEGTEIGFGGTLFMPDIKTTIDGFADGELTSDADINMIPEVSIAHKINENWYMGVGMWGTAGLGVDYSNATFDPTMGQMGNFNMVTNIQLLQFGVPIAYKTGGLSLAVTPILQYGNLDINYQAQQFDATGTPSGFASNGAGLAQDFGFGYNLGMAYDFNNGLTFGLLYKSKIDMEYKNQLTTATQPFGLNLPDGDHLEQPAEMGVGVAYVMGQHTFAFDYKQIQWSDAKGYKDFGWEDSDVYAVGYQYSEHNWALRLGYNHASSAVVEGQDSRLNFFNLLGFPATAESHYTLGGSYALTEQFSVDVAYVYAPKNTESFDVTALGFLGDITNSHTENSVSFQLAYKF